MPLSLGGWLSPALAIGALDEEFLFHERFKYSGAPLIAGKGTELSRWIGDLPTLTVGVVGVLLIFVFTRTVKQKAPCRLMQVAVAVRLVALWVDLGTPPPWLERFEEGIEVLAETLFLCALLEVSSAHVQSSTSS